MPARRIVIYGVTGSGKTTLGRRLAQELGLTHIELDGLFHGPGWTPAPTEQFRERVRAAVDANPAGWVADGNYTEARGVLLPLADTVVWLRLPWRVSYLRMLRRSFVRLIRGTELWNGNRETLRNLLFERDSLLLWGIRQHRASQERVRASLAGIPHRADVFEVRSQREVEDLVRRFVAEKRAEAATGAVAAGEADRAGAG
jgi:adenylate kinase family enzyme